MATDFEAEGLLEGVEGEDARKARLDLLCNLEEEGVPPEELRAAVEENRLPLLPVERVLSGKGKRYTREEVVEEVGLELDLLIRLWRALGQPEIPSGEAVFPDGGLQAARRVKRFLHARGPQ